MYWFDDVWFKYRDWVFQGYSGHIAESKVGIIGLNGVGKTTLLRLLDRQLHPQRGYIVVDGSTYMVEFDIKRYGAFVMDDMVDICARLKAFDVSRADNIIKALSIEDYRQTPIADLSKGTAKKVSLLMGLLSTAEVLLVDEPFESIDPVSNDQLIRLLDDRVGGVVIVSHDHAVLGRCVDRVFEVVHQGLVARSLGEEARPTAKAEES